MSKTSIDITASVELRVIAETLHLLLQRQLEIGRDVTQRDLDIIKRCGELAHEIEATR